MIRDTSKLPLGASYVAGSGTRFRVWAPRRKSVAVVTDERGTAGQTYDLQRQPDGYFVGHIADIRPGTRYRYLLDKQLSRPDPASRFQPEGVHGPSQVMDAHAYHWTDQDWRGIRKRDLIVYELHVGAFTAAGTFRAAIDRLAELQRLGVTAVEIMPVAQSPGKWNWGYDGVDLFAVRNSYGKPDDLKALVDACHARGMAAIMDVVYNHLGPEGNYLGDYGPYFSRRHRTPWGEAFNFDGEQSDCVRQFVIDNALFWLDEYHFDGLRLDAVHFMLDDSDPHILQSIRGAVAEFEAAAKRDIHLIAEANVFDDSILTGDSDSYSAIWCDCLMHAIYSHGVPDLRLTPRTYNGSADIAETLRYAHLYSMPGVVRASRPVPGSDSPDMGRLHEQPDRSYIDSLVIALQTHDSVGNHPHGQRLHQLTSIAFQKAAAALVLLYPSIPLIFMGEESAAESPFPFFVDFEDPHLRQIVDQGRASEYPQHEWRGAVSPSDPQAFQRAKCHDPANQHPEVLDWYRLLIALRKEGIAQGWLSPDRLVTRYDPEQTRFTLEYRIDPAKSMTVEVRLALQGSAADAIAIDGRIVLDSEDSDASSTPRPARLHPVHALVVEATAAEDAYL